MRVVCYKEYFISDLTFILCSNRASRKKVQFLGDSRNQILISRNINNIFNLFRTLALLKFWGVFFGSLTENVVSFWVHCCPSVCHVTDYLAEFFGDDHCRRQRNFLISQGKILLFISKYVFWIICNSGKTPDWFSCTKSFLG